MWRQFIEYARQVLALKQQTDRNTADIKALQQDVKELTAAVQRLAYELHRVSENESHEREKMALRLELAMTKFENRLLTGGKEPPAME
ncbi:MAG: hypothetical protein JO250_00630 [Armatimonadetes bacterium]|nr:hypothetical protein [Armatimonadota bacterium]